MFTGDLGRYTSNIDTPYPHAQLSSLRCKTDTSGSLQVSPLHFNSREQLGQRKRARGENWGLTVVWVDPA